ncbi:MAG: cyclic nucleotide-binding domain-containing protein [Granulosicoccus sp.]
MKPLSANGRHFRNLRKLPLVQSIDDERWETLKPHIKFREIGEGEALFSAGRESETLYMVIEGELGLYLPGATNSISENFYLQPRLRGETAGDFAVLNGGAHLVTAIAKKRTRVATFPRFAFELLIDIDPGILAHVYDVAAELSRRVTLARVYLDLFGNVSPATMESLLKATVIHHYMSGDVLFEEGDEADGLHIVVSGRLHIETSDVNGVRHRMAEIRAPEMVGELALLAGSRRSATAVAARESTVALLDRASFDSLITTQANLLLSVSQMVVRRHVANTPHQQQEQSSDRNFVVIPLDSRLPLRRFIHQLKRELREMGKPLTLDARGFDTLYGKTGASQTAFKDVFNAAIAEWMDDKESRYDQVIYLTEGNWSDWTRRCINRADRILLLASGDSDNTTVKRSIERELAVTFATARSRPPVDLVLLHAADTKNPTGTDRWLKPRRLDAYHHVRIDDRYHFGRLARRIAGCARGIVFSGGGARGYAHLGVQRLLEEQDIRIDYIGGSSMGGLLGATLAMGHSYKQISALSATFANKKALFDYTLPLASLMSSNKLTRFCKSVYGDVRIEDLWIPYFCVSSNLADGREVLHDRGELWKVIRSTISLPGIFAPVPMPNGDLLIDGAVLNSFPVDVMHRCLGGSGNIIGVNVSQIPERFDYYDYGTALSGWKVFLSRINPFRPSIRIPRLVETLLRSTDIKSIIRLNETRALLEILVEPDVSDIPLLDFKKYATISEIGYQAALEVFTKHGLCVDGQCEIPFADLVDGKTNLPQNPEYKTIGQLTPK